MDSESLMIDQGTRENSQNLDHGIVVENIVVSSRESVKFSGEGPSEGVPNEPGKTVVGDSKERVTGEGIHQVDRDPLQSSRHRHVININLEQVSGGVGDSEAKGKEMDSRKVLEENRLTKNVAKEEASCVVDVMCGKESKTGENLDGEVVCRICHLSADQSPKASRAAAAATTTTTSSMSKDFMQLGCMCKGELGTAHRHCAEAWFKLKGNRFCEICGEVAKNVMGVGDSRFMEAWNERRFSINNGSSERGRCWQGQPVCNFLMACLVIAFVLPWFFRVNMF